VEDLERYREAVDTYWQSVDIFFDDLPDENYRMGRLLRQNMAAAQSTTGSFHDILRRPNDHPLLHYHLWLLDDLGVPQEERTPLEEHLFTAAVFTLCLVAIEDGINAPDSFIDTAYVGLADALEGQRSVELASVVDELDPGPAPFATSALAVLEAIGRDRDRDAMLAMLDHVDAVFRIKGEVLAIRRDLARGVISPSVQLMIDGADLSDERTESPEALLGALLVAGAIDQLAPVWRGHIEQFADSAGRLGLPTFERYADQLSGMMGGLSALLRIPTAVVTPPGLRFLPASDPRGEAIAAAGRFLLADPTMREAWEVHRWGMEGAAEVTARFPAGLVIEVLGRHGGDVADLVDDYYRQVAVKQFAYYDHPDLPYVETDTLGTMLRLYSYSKQTEWHRGVLDEYVGLLEARAGSADRLPVWLTTRGEHVVLGEGCATIEANLLRGLIDYDSVRFADLVKRPAGRLLEEFAERGTAITVNYPRFYLLAVLASLLVTLDQKGITDTKEGWERLAMQIDIETARDRMSPMTAACLSLACTHPQTTSLLDASWETVILKGQAIDGGWTAEPMFFAPNRGAETTWYSSRLLTSAVCYDALNARSVLPSP